MTARKQAPETRTLDALAKELGRDKTKANVRTLERYKAQKANGVVNPIVLAQLMGIKPQMVYNYIRKGRFSEVSYEENNTQKRVIHIGEANTFAAQYAERKAAKQAKLEAELQGEKETVAAE